MVDIREEKPSDFALIREVNNRAFNDMDEARLVERLRADGLVIASLVAVESGGVVGHILFSELSIGGAGSEIRAASLAPMAVRPECQHRGIGSALVRAGLKRCKAQGVALVIVLGHPEYYPRFGFSALRAEGLKGPFTGDAFMALELTPGILDGVTGTVQYPAAFGLDDPHC